MTAEDLYRRIGRLLEIAPSCPTTAALPADFMKWVGQADALVGQTGNMIMKVEIGAAIASLPQYAMRQAAYQKLMLTLYKALAAVELQAPPSAQGAFIPVGNAFDAYASLSKILGTATSDLLIVDPYLDDTVLTDFGGSVPELATLRLLADSASVKANLAPAVKAWQLQHTRRKLEVRLAPARTLHDRAIFVDGTSAWTVTQSLKDFAKRSPGEIVRADDTAALKIAAYETIWSSSTPI